MTGFELVFITDPALNDKDLESLQKNIKMSLSKSKGKLVHEYLWGRRRLAYEIEGNDFGVYHAWYFTGIGKTVDELQRQFGFSDDVLRNQIVKTEDLDAEASFLHNLIPPREETLGKDKVENSVEDVTKVSKMTEIESEIETEAETIEKVETDSVD